MRPAREWRYAAVAFGVTLMLGLAFLLFPGVGITTLTIVMMLVFLVEGVVSILLGLRMSGNLRHWGWMLFSGACSLIVGLIIMMGWPVRSPLRLTADQCPEDADRRRPPGLILAPRPPPTRTVPSPRSEPP